MRIAVVGAGISGLIAAYELKKSGCDVVVYEKEPFVAGRVRTHHKGEEFVDIGAQFLSLCYTETQRYFEELGIDPLFIKSPKLFHQVFTKGELYNCNSTQGFSFLSAVAKFRLGLFIGWLKMSTKGVSLFQSETHEDETDDLDAFTYAERFIGTECARTLIDGVIAAYQFERSEEVSASILRAAASSLLNEGLGPNAYCIGGIDKLARSLAGCLQVKTNCEVKEVLPHEGSISLLGTTFIEKFDAVLLAVPASQAMRIYSGATEEQLYFLKSISYASTATVVFRMPLFLSKTFSVVIVPENENDTIASYYPFWLRDPAHQEQDPALVGVWLRDKAAKVHLAMKDQELISRVRTEFLSVCPPLASHENLVKGAYLFRFNEAMPKFSPGCVGRYKNFVKKGQGALGVFFCGDYMNSPWIEGSVRSGKKAAQTIIARLAAGV